ncbi:sensor histidine kinase [Jatrophihabitans sp. GAS493]|uniref:sensor histidine kinase n=1 Tax=Jatrophihabitans sp. GAS493 TaxID=1907575 RepID=UPI0015610CCF|nr:ATP-binding protein [Jatrophihabitans sp. GAS493]
MLTDLLIVAGEIDWSSEDPPDLTGLLRAVLAEVDCDDGVLTLTVDNESLAAVPKQHCWSVKGSLSMYESDGSTTPPAGPTLSIPGGFIVAAGAGRRDRARLVDLIDLLSPVWQLARSTLQTLASRAKYEEHASEIGRVRLEAAAGMDLLRLHLERDLHDGAQNELVALTMRASLLAEDIHDERWPEAQARVSQLAEHLEESQRTLARAVSGVSPDALRENGLLAALRAAGLPTQRLTFAEPDGEPRRYPAVIEVTAHYIALEAITNALKHAVGTTVRVTVTDAYGGLEFEVSDSGPGIADVAGSASLRFLRERAEAVGGRLEVQSASSGTVIRAEFPL